MMLFTNVRARVMAATGNKQTPWSSSSVTGSFYFNPGKAQANATTGANSTSGAMDRETVFWQSIANLNDRELYAAYLRRYPQGAFVAIAKVKLRKMQPAKVTPKVNRLREDIKKQPQATELASKPKQMPAIQAVRLPPSFDGLWHKLDVENGLNISATVKGQSIIFDLVLGGYSYLMETNITKNGKIKSITVSGAYSVDYTLKGFFPNIEWERFGNGMSQTGTVKLERRN